MSTYLRPTFLSFETAKKALSVSQQGLDTVGHNISNAGTTGYTRQRVDVVSIGSTGYAEKYRAYNEHHPGLGSEVTGINQIRDPQLDRRYRTEVAQAGEYNAISEGLLEINNIFDEIETDGLHYKMGEFLDALDRLISSADTKEHASVLRNRSEQVAQMLQENYNALGNAETQMRSELEASVGDVNQILEQIAVLNVKIKYDNFYGNPSNDLNDQRNLLIDQLSEYVDIDIIRTPVKAGDGWVEEVSINLMGSGNEAKGIPPINLVDSGNYNGFSVTYNEEGEARVNLIDGISGMELKQIKEDGTKSADITENLYTGMLKGYVCVLNGKGVFAGDGDNTFRGILYYREALNDYANTFATMMNDMNSLKVYDSSGEVHAISRDLFVNEDGDGGPITAGNIAVSDEWLANPQYIETASENNALYTEAQDAANSNGNAGYLFLKPATEGGELQPIWVKYSDVASVDSNGYLRNADGELLNRNGQVVDVAEDAVNISELQRAITVESIVENPEFVAEHYLNASGNIEFINANGGINYPDGTKTTEYVAATLPGVSGDLTDLTIDEDGYLLDDSGNRITISHPDPTARGEVGEPFDKTWFTANSVMTYNHSATAKADIDPADISGVDDAGYLLDNDGKRYRLEYPAGSGTQLNVNVTQLTQHTTPIHRNDLKRFTEADTVMYNPGDVTPNVLLPGASANDHLLDIKIAINDSTRIFANGFTGSFQEYLVGGFQNDMAQDKEINDTLLETSLNIVSGLSDSRDSVSAVSIDEEGINMMTYQNFYNAAARYMTTLDEAVGKIIEEMGIVGR